MNWKRVYTPSELKRGMLVAFATKLDDKITELWNEQFTVEQVIPNTQGNIEIWLKTNEEENLVVYWDEIDKMWIPA